jgi:hypothetical protein
MAPNTPTKTLYILTISIVVVVDDDDGVVFVQLLLLDNQKHHNPKTLKNTKIT